MRTRIIFMLLALIVVFLSGCMEEKNEIFLNESSNASSYEYDIFLNESGNETVQNTTTYYLLEDKTKVQVVNAAVNTTKHTIYPSESLGGRSEGDPIKNFVLLVGPANETPATSQSFETLALKNATVSVNYNLTEEVSQSMRVINLEFEEPVTGFIAYTLEIPATQSFAFMKPESEFIRVVLPEGYATGNRVFGIPRPEPSNVSVDAQGRQTLLWISSEIPARQEVIQVKYYSESAPLYFLAAIVVLLFGVGLVLFHYSRSKRELESVRDILDLEKEYDKDHRRRR
ncbi:MAG: DUF5803 family protein [Methanosarcina sp.]